MERLTPHELTLIARPDHATMLGQVETWAAINSGTRNLEGLAVVAGLLADAFSHLPGNVELVDAAPVDAVKPDGSVEPLAHGQHLVARIRPEAPFRMLFTGHMDTVFGADHSFQSLQWLEDGVLNGPGVADMKGGISVMLAALQAVEANSRYGGLNGFGYDILINSDEEVGSASSAALIAELARGKVAAFTYEPSALPDGTLAGARAGTGNFSIIITGKSAHAGRNPDDGRNALVAAADLAVRLKSFHRAGLSVNPAKIDGGGPNNVVPDHAVLRVNFRPQTPADVVFADTMLDDVIAEIAARHDVSVHRHGSFNRPPKPMDDKAQKLFDHVKLCGADLGQVIGWKDSGGVCDGNNIAASGVPVVDTMGVRGGSIHSADEFMISHSLAERAQLSALAIYRMVQKGGL